MTYIIKSSLLDYNEHAAILPAIQHFTDDGYPKNQGPIAIAPIAEVKLDEMLTDEIITKLVKMQLTLDDINSFRVIYSTYEQAYESIQRAKIEYNRLSYREPRIVGGTMGIDALEIVKLSDLIPEINMTSSTSKDYLSKLDTYFASATYV